MNNEEFLLKYQILPGKICYPSIDVQKRIRVIFTALTEIGLCIEAQQQIKKNMKIFIEISFIELVGRKVVRD